MTIWRRWIKKRPGPDASRQARQESQRAIKEALSTGASDDIVKRILEAAEIAEREGDAVMLRRYSDRLLRLELFDPAWELYVRANRLSQQGPLPQWDGSDLAERSLLVTYAPRDSIGEELRLSRFIAPVAQRARRCMVLAERRLVPLLRRTFPGADVRARGVDDDAAFAEADVTASYQTIAFHHARTAEALQRSFVPLRPDPSRVASIRQRYRDISRGPLIGISWWSRTKRKDLPDVADWAPLLRGNEAGIVSLQHGDIKHDLEVLQDLAGGRVIQDAEIDQFADLDGFAAQIAALDAVVSISNTTIDMAGMLGVPTVHLRDDKYSPVWQPSGPSSWYPGMVFLYRQNRPWSDALAEAATHVEQMASTAAA